MIVLQWLGARELILGCSLVVGYDYSKKYTATFLRICFTIFVLVFHPLWSVGRVYQTKLLFEKGGICVILCIILMPHIYVQTDFFLPADSLSGSAFRLAFTLLQVLDSV